MHFHSHGKLLITGEYLVLDGARALAVPTRQGQSLEVEVVDGQQGIVHWLSFAADGGLWFEGWFDLASGLYLKGTDHPTGTRLQQLFQAALGQQSPKLAELPGHSLRVQTRLDFPRNWGLGSSSTLVANLAQWWDLDPYLLLAQSFGGSGYDLACARAEGPIFYQLAGKTPLVDKAPFSPPFAEGLYFLFLEQKQDSREGIARYRKRQGMQPEAIEAISRLAGQATQVNGLTDFQELITRHEQIISQVIGFQPIKQRLFQDLPGAVKSLGAWGGDFALVASDLPFEALQAYFSKRNYPLLIPYQEMVFHA